MSADKQQFGLGRPRVAFYGANRPRGKTEAIFSNVAEQELKQELVILLKSVKEERCMSGAFSVCLFVCYCYSC